MIPAWVKERGITVLDSVPDGWKEIKGATTAPKGYVWYSNGKSLFSGEYEDALVREYPGNMLTLGASTQQAVEALRKTEKFEEVEP